MCCTEAVIVSPIQVEPTFELLVMLKIDPSIKITKFHSHEKRDDYAIYYPFMV